MASGGCKIAYQRMASWWSHLTKAKVLPISWEKRKRSERSILQWKIWDVFQKSKNLNKEDFPIKPKRIQKNEVKKSNKTDQRIIKKKLKPHPLGPQTRTFSPETILKFIEGMRIPPFGVMIGTLVKEMTWSSMITSPSPTNDKLCWQTSSSCSSSLKWSSLDSLSSFVWFGEEISDLMIWVLEYFPKPNNKDNL